MMSNENLFCLFGHQFTLSHEIPALVDAEGNGPTFGELSVLSAQFAAALRDHGVTVGDRVVVQVEKSIGAVALYLACLRLGAIYVPLNTAYTPAEVDYFLEDAEPRVFVSSKARQDIPTPNLVLGIDDTSPLWAEALSTAPLETIATRAADDIAAILYTSGTTGRSKGAMLSHGNLASNALALYELWGFKPDDVLIHALPIFHVHGLFVALHTMFLNGSTTIFLPKFDSDEVVRLLPRATMLMGVPTFYTRLLTEPRLSKDMVNSMRLFISGSAPLLAETHLAFEARTGHRILERYGMTEAGMITSNPLDGERIAGTVGYPLPGVSLRITGEGGVIAGPNEPGLIEISGPNVFKGYWRNPGKTAEDLRADGWFVTGDIGKQSEDGRVEIVGRAKDLIIAGGFNIYPKEIEQAIDDVPGVIESAVIGIPHRDLGEAVIGVVTVDPAFGLTGENIMETINGSLARFKQPRKIHIVDALPRNAMGKVQKAELRKQFNDIFAG